MEGREGTPNECAPQSSASVRRCHGEMMNEPTTSVVAAENGGNDQLLVGGDEAETGVAFEKAAHVLERIRVAEPNTFS